MRAWPPCKLLTSQTMWCTRSQGGCDHTEHRCPPHTLSAHLPNSSTGTSMLCNTPICTHSWLYHKPGAPTTDAGTLSGGSCNQQRMKRCLRRHVVAGNVTCELVGPGYCPGSAPTRLHSKLHELCLLPCVCLCICL